ncbi:MAG: hypothetical protein ACYSR1_10370 [Planctomycetota bacterium]
MHEFPRTKGAEDKARKEKKDIIHRKDAKSAKERKKKNLATDFHRQIRRAKPAILVRS